MSVSVWQRVYRGSKSGQRATLALTFGGKSTRLHAGWVHGWSATPFEEGCARSRRIIRETQLGAAHMLLGGTGRLDRRRHALPASPVSLVRRRSSTGRRVDESCSLDTSPAGRPAGKAGTSVRRQLSA